MHNARKVSKIRTLRECLLKVKGVKLQRQNDTRLSDDENKDEGLYNELKTIDVFVTSECILLYVL